MTSIVDSFRIRWAADRAAGTGAGQVRADADTDARSVSLSLPDGQRLTLDVVAARATSMLLGHVIFAVLHPDGPFLGMEAATGTGWVDLREAR